ncbi:hypothetical protein GMOD_00006116 [Pyrenophora seminiperda CCB06]|uniref:Uncharacterized protein n=1 Tax=Pyrenophora seminiperda CCB06 TaxID=1302712 RepID=A0A3M7M4D2_9PLEO|nr:hypothetical protein GMOD_00006116 [Pyrenophora seminiperda CCB06]
MDRGKIGPTGSSPNSIAITMRCAVAGGGTWEILQGAACLCSTPTPTHTVSMYGVGVGKSGCVIFLEVLFLLHRPASCPCPPSGPSHTAATLTQMHLCNFPALSSRTLNPYPYSYCQEALPRNQALLTGIPIVCHTVFVVDGIFLLRWCHCRWYSLRWYLLAFCILCNGTDIATNPLPSSPDNSSSLSLNPLPLLSPYHRFSHRKPTLPFLPKPLLLLPHPLKRLLSYPRRHILPHARHPRPNRITPPLLYKKLPPRLIQHLQHPFHPPLVPLPLPPLFIFFEFDIREA